MDLFDNKDNISSEENLSWDYISWIKDFKVASETDEGFRELRAKVFQDTIQIVKNGQYYVENNLIKLNQNNSNHEIQTKTVFYEKVENLPANKEKKYETKVSVINADCVEIGNLLRKLEYNPAVLNMANRQNPGGGVLYGAGAQEENIFRRSNLYLSLYQFAEYAEEYGLTRNKINSYPINRESGGIYSPDVTIFRASEQNGYFLLKEPFELSFVTVPAINRPEIIQKNSKYELVENLIEPTKLKIRAILKIALINNHDSIVLSAFGCGAFRNPPEHISLLFKEVIEEEEFDGKFKLIVFAIIEDHNSWHKHNPEGNIIPFQKILD